MILSYNEPSHHFPVIWKSEPNFGLIYFGKTIMLPIQKIADFEYKNLYVDYQTIFFTDFSSAQMYIHDYGRSL